MSRLIKILKLEEVTSKFGVKVATLIIKFGRKSILAIKDTVIADFQANVKQYALCILYQENVLH